MIIHCLSGSLDHLKAVLCTTLVRNLEITWEYIDPLVSQPTCSFYVTDDNGNIFDQPGLAPLVAICSGKTFVNGAQLKFFELISVHFERYFDVILAEHMGIADYSNDHISHCQQKVNQFLDYLDQHLASSNFVAGNKPQPVDGYVYACIYPLIIDKDLNALLEGKSGIAKWIGKWRRFAKLVEPFTMDTFRIVQLVTVVPHHLRREYEIREPESAYYTTPIYYVNGEPHVGHVYTTLLTDIAVRWHRMMGWDVLFQTGTDEHGLKVQQTAEKNGVEPKDWCDSLIPPFKEAFERYNFSYDRFIRTTDEDHVEAATFMWKKLLEGDHIYRGEFKSWYSVSDEQFLTNMDVEPLKDANGQDVIEDGEVVHISTLSGHRVVWQCEENFMFRLTNFQDILLEHYERHPEFVSPYIRKKEMLMFIRSGLRDISFSRSHVSWGIPVPDCEGETMYVWCDALTNYLTGTGWPVQETKWWPASVHLIGKDILRFHAVIWPAMLIAAGIELPKRIIAHGWWTRNGQKISKSLGNAFDVFEMADTWGVDLLRYYMAGATSHGSDGDFVDAHLAQAYLSDLADSLGNIICRAVALTVTESDCVPAFNEEKMTELDHDILKKMRVLCGAIDHQMISIETSRVVQLIREFVGDLNSYFQARAPWKLLKTDKDERDTVIYIVQDLLRRVAIVLSPFMPETMTKLLDILAVAPEHRVGKDSLLNECIVSGTKLNLENVVLFPKDMPVLKDFYVAKHQKGKKGKK
ncbi:hypothetical protein PCE1_003777 [Barthelona sp. PCE]